MKAIKVQPLGNSLAEKAVKIGEAHYEKGFHGWYQWNGTGQGWVPVVDAKLIRKLQRAK